MVADVETSVAAADVEVAVPSPGGWAGAAVTGQWVVSSRWRGRRKGSGGDVGRCGWWQPR